MNYCQAFIEFRLEGTRSSKMQLQGKWDLFEASQHVETVGFIDKSGWKMY